MAKTIGTAGRTHAMGTGFEVKSIKVTPNGRGMREIMQGQEAQAAVNKYAEKICSTANLMRGSRSEAAAVYVVHPRVLRVSAHAFVDPANYEAMLAQHYHQTLEKAFWEVQGR